MTAESTRIIALATCHNRKDFTLRALQSLIEQSLPDRCKLEICLVDDGCEDGTGEAVRANFPSVKILRGSGSLYWAGGMRFGWDRYVKHQAFRYLLVFNDDIEITEGAIQTLLCTASEVEKQGSKLFAVVAAFQDLLEDKLNYGGLILKPGIKPLQFHSVVPSSEMQDCDTLNMNFALISKPALEKTDFLSPQFKHAKADFDFGLRLKKTGGRVVLAPGFAGRCLSNRTRGTSREADLSLVEQWRRITGIKEEPPGDRAVFCKRHAGMFWPIVWAIPYVRLIVCSAVLKSKRLLAVPKLKL